MNLLGVDLGIRKAAISVFRDGTCVEVYAIEAHSAAPRAKQLREVAQFVHELVANTNADWVWIESIIIGNNRKYSIALAETMGAVLSVLAYAPIKIGSVDNKQWKREVLGFGNADKESIKKWLKHTHPAYAQLCGSDQDKYDAICIGLYGEEILRRSDDLTLD